MKTNWQTKKLGGVCDIGMGKTPSRGNRKFWDTEKQTGNVWLSIADLLNAKDKVITDSKEYISDAGAKISKIVKTGTLLASFKLTLGRLAFTGKDLYTNEAIAALFIKSEKEISKEFLYYFLSFFDWHAATKGDVKVKGKTLNKAKLKELEIPLPPLAEQKRIVKKLDEVFEAVRQAKENAEKNLRNSRELFESYLQSVFANPGKGWEEKSLGEICDVEYGYTEKARSKGNYRFVRITDTDENGLLTKENKMYVGSFDSVSKYILNEGDLLMARTGASAGNVLLFEGDEKAVFASYLIRMRFQKEILSKLYWYFSKSKLYWDQVRQLSAGSAQPQFNGGVLKQVVFTYPKFLPEQKAIVKKLDELAEETKKLAAIFAAKIAALDELKRSVLAKAFSGEL